MKYRTDFVTNSSSSSFILSAAKLGDNVTKDTVFGIVKGLCLELAEKAKAADAYLKEKYNITRQWCEFNSSRVGSGCKYEAYTTENGDDLRLSEEYRNINADVSEQFGVELDEMNSTDECELPWWIDISTYDEFLKAGQNANTVNLPLPFTIYDYRYDKIYKQAYDHTEVLHWYISCFDEYEKDRYTSCAFINDACGREVFCSDCDKQPHFDYDDYNCNSGRCYKVSRNSDCCSLTKCMVESNYTRQELLLQLGDFCVFGWETNLSRYVNRKLSELSNHSCTHMG